MTKKINLVTFLSGKDITFESTNQAVAWARRALKLTSLRQISKTNYLVDEEEITKAYEDYVARVEALYQQRKDKIIAINVKKTSKKHT
jgi:hypothetical protein